ncbi:N-6 DNA methylase [Streptomyces sp. NPDC055107]
MARLTLAQLERHLVGAMDILRGSMDAAECRDLVSALLLLKRFNDAFEATRDVIIAEALAAGRSHEEALESAEAHESYRTRGVLYVPEEARWERLAGAAADGVVGRYVYAALDSLEIRQGNEELRGLFDHVGLGRGYAARSSSAGHVVEERVAALVKSLGTLRLSDEDLGFPGTIGAAYEYLVKESADAAGSRGGEFYTPRAVSRMMVELARPTAGMRVYDPCVGSGGMLIHAKEYVDDHSGDSSGLLLAGQDVNGGSWAMATMNMLFHGVERFSLEAGDTLTDPRHRGGDFDLVLSNPPFSMDYSRAEVPDLKERMPYGEAPEKGKSDLMFLQHMLHMVRGRGGSVYTVMPHGVLFRGGEEQRVRSGLLDARMVEAVIGLPPNLFHGTGIPACVMVLREPEARSEEMRDTVLFIDGSRDFRATRARNVLLPEHVERIVSAFHARTDVEGFARLVGRDEIAEARDSLAVQRYVDGPPPEPQDLRAHLVGGVPVAEIRSKESLLDAYGVTTPWLFARRPDDDAYVDHPTGREDSQAERLTRLAGERETDFRRTFEEWWLGRAADVDALARQRGERACSGPFPGDLRAGLFASARHRLVPVGPLDRDAVGSALADWWQATGTDLKILAHHGFRGLVDHWVGDVLMEGRGQAGLSAAERRQVYQHEVVSAILPTFVDELAAAEQALADLKELRPTADLRRDQTRAKRAVRVVENSFWGTAPGRRSGDGTPASMPRLARARAALDAQGDRAVVLGILGRRLADRLDAQLLRRRRELLGSYENWESKYRLSFREIERQLSGKPEAFIENNPWSRESPWSFDSIGPVPGGTRHKVARRLHEIIDTEKAVEAATAKLDIDLHMLLIPLFAPRAESGETSASCPLRDVVSVAWQGNYTRPAAEGEGDGLPAVRGSALVDDGIALSRMSRTSSVVSSDHLLRDGDVLFTLGLAQPHEPHRAAVWRKVLPEATVSQGVLCLTPDHDRLDSDYLAAWLRHPMAQVRLRSEAITESDASFVTGRGQLSVSRMLDVEIELPPVSKQRQLAESCAVLLGQRARRRKQLAKLRLIKETMMNDLVADQISVSYL